MQNVLFCRDCIMTSFEINIIYLSYSTGLMHCPWGNITIAPLEQYYHSSSASEFTLTDISSINQWLPTTKCKKVGNVCIILDNYILIA